MRLIVTGGGTGGHIYPAVAIADKFRKMNPDCEVLYIGAKRGMEGELVPKLGYNIKLVDAMGLDRSDLFRAFDTAEHVIHGIAEARSIIKSFKPDYIVGTGGYVCFPAIYAGSQLGIPCYLHEQNAFPGLANRKLEKRVKKIFLGFEEGREYFNDKSKIFYSGNPVRESFSTLTKEAARAKLGFKESDIVVLSFGGSLGAETINDAAYELMKKLNGKQGYKMVFGTGKRYYADVLKKIGQEGIIPDENIIIKDYIEDMENYLMACDIVIERSGALSVAETTMCSKVSVLIPSPNVTQNHQFFNAKAVADHDGAILIEEKDLDNKTFAEKVLELLSDKEKLEAMGKNAHEMAPTKALDIIYNGIVNG